MNLKSEKNLAPFSNESPLVPGRRGADPIRWRLERDKQQLRDEYLDLAKVLRRFAQEMLGVLLYLKDPDKSPEKTQRLGSQILGALKRESSSLTSMFAIEELHPALLMIFQKQQSEPPAQTIEPPAFELPGYFLPEPERKVTLREMLSNREFEILTLLLADEKPKAIAERLGINKQTINSTLHRIKLKARELAEKGNVKP